MKMPKFITAGLLLLASCGSLLAQINLNYLYSRAVKDGYNAVTQIDTVLLETNVSNGVATTLLTMVIKPLGYKPCNYVAYTVDSIMTSGTGSYKTQYRYVCTENEILLDSIEISESFTLPTDFVAKNLYLWVNGQKQTGYIQDRSLANQQYTQIVGKRKDPALLESWGNGSYNLRIFPTKSYVARKVCIEWQHTFNDDSLNLITACLPVSFDTINNYNYNLGYGNLTIGYLRATCIANDSRLYAFSMPGLGEGKFSAGQSLVLEKTAVKKIGYGTISTGDPSGTNSFVWSGIDKNKKINIGFSTIISDSNVVKEPEPDTRIIVLDIGQEVWNWNNYNSKRSAFLGNSSTYNPYVGYTDVNLLARAQKYAVLCLQNYVNKNQKFNIVLTQKGRTIPLPVFDAPVYPTAENLITAFAAIVNATISTGTAKESLAAALKQAGKGIVIFISDLYQPYDYYSYVNNVYNVGENGKKYDVLIDTLSQLVKSSGAWFFTMSDDYRLSTIAYTSGGFGIASLRWDYYCQYETYTTSDNILKSRIKLNPLFENNYRGITGVTVTAPSSVTDCAYTTDNTNYYYATGDIRIVGLGLKKATTVALPYYYYNNKTMLRFAGRLSPQTTTGTIDFIVTGKIGGLGFTKKITGTILSTTNTSMDMQDNVQWAYRKTEQYGNSDWTKYADSIKAIGLDYHIVTRQTSLLALEPGMELFKDTVAQQSTSDSRAATVSTNLTGGAVDTSTKNSSESLDKRSLEELISGVATVIMDKNIFKVSDIVVKSLKGKINIAVPSIFYGKEISMSLYNMLGKQIMKKTIVGNKANVWNLDRNVLSSKGFYMVKVKVGNIEKISSVPVVW